MNINNNFDNNSWQQINEFLKPDDIINLSRTSKHLKNITKPTFDKISSDDKSLYKLQKFNSRIEKLKDSNRKLKESLEIITANNTDHVCELIDQKDTFKGSIANIAIRVQLIEKILTVFSLFTKEIDQQRKLIISIKNEAKIIQRLSNYSNKKESEIRSLELKKQSLEIELKNIIEKRQDEAAWETVYDLFGGKQNFLKIPILDLNKIKYDNTQGEYLGTIKTEDVPHAIVRGYDKHKRPFFALKDNNSHVHVFFRLQEGYWSDAGIGAIPSFGGYWIHAGNVKQEIVNNLKTFIQQNRALD